MPRQKKLKLREDFSEIFGLLQLNYPEAKCALYFRNPLELLIATILSAQCTDVRVNIVTPELFKKYPSVKSFSEAKIEELEQVIRSINFYKNKSKNIKAACQMIVEKFNGKVPEEMSKLIELPGVARKTANVVLSNAFFKHEGIVVDTHVGRLSQRLGLTRQKTPEKIEKDLVEIVPSLEWGNFSHLLIEHGRKICKAQRPLCENCFLNNLCPFGIKFLQLSGEKSKL